MVLQRSAKTKQNTWEGTCTSGVSAESAKDHGIISKSGSRWDLHAVRSGSFVESRGRVLCCFKVISWKKTNCIFDVCYFLRARKSFALVLFG